MGETRELILGDQQNGGGGGGKARGLNPEPSQSSLPFSVISPALGSVRCPVCLSAESCGSAAELTCPAESAHCYSGVLLLSAGEPDQDLSLWGGKGAEVWDPEEGGPGFPELRLPP